MEGVRRSKLKLFNAACMVFFLPPSAACMMQTGAAVVQDQLEADEDASLQQRVLKSTGTVLGGAAEVIGEENEIIGGERGVGGSSKVISH